MEMTKRCFFCLVGAWLCAMTTTAYADRNARYTGEGEVLLANITPEQARVQARNAAFVDIIQQATGFEISSRQFVVNNQMASYHILQTRKARVIDSRCDYRVQEIEGRLYQHARCEGAVQSFGKSAPSLHAGLLKLGNRPECRFRPSDLVRAQRPEQSNFAAGERFCLLLHGAEDQWLGVFGLYEDNGQLRISRVLPEDGESAYRLRAGEVPVLTPLASTPLPEQDGAHEALLVLNSHRPIPADMLAPSQAGLNAQATAAASIDMREFDRALGRLPLDEINITVLPYRISR